MVPRTGDVVVSRLTARREHEIFILPAATGAVCPSQQAAVVQACDLALEHRVDAWLTEDHIHFLRIAAYRAEAART